MGTRITASYFRISTIHICSNFIRMDKSLPKERRKSHIEHGNIYFWTATINKWYRLLEKDEYKDVIIESLQYLADTGKIDVYAFIIMPNHIHLIWRINEPNGKESPQSSLLKHTAHAFKQMLKAEGAGKLAAYKVDADNKQFEFWQRDSLAIRLFTKKVASALVRVRKSAPMRVPTHRN